MKFLIGEIATARNKKRYFFYLDAGMLWDRNKNYVRNEWNPISKTSCCTIKNETRSFIFNNAKDKRNPILPRILTMFALLSTSENDMRSKYLCVYQAVGYFEGIKQGIHSSKGRFYTTIWFLVSSNDTFNSLR